jgi:polysaccharide export outer membrane protein
MKTRLFSFSLSILLSTVGAAGAQSSTQTPPRPLGTTGPGASPTRSESSPAKPAANIAADYRLVPGDKLRIEVYKDPQLSQSVQVRPDGKITLPLANDVMAAGQTPAELRDSIASSLKPYISNPTVTVMVVETVPPVIYVMGEVNQPGAQQLPLTGRLDVMQALAAAGGFKDFADTKNIKVRRGSELLKFNYKDAVDGRGTPIVLKPGDTVIVP